MQIDMPSGGDCVSTGVGVPGRDRFGMVHVWYDPAYVRRIAS
jgi:hypothetical protein